MAVSIRQHSCYISCVILVAPTKLRFCMWPNFCVARGTNYSPVHCTGTIIVWERALLSHSAPPTSPLVTSNGLIAGGGYFCLPMEGRPGPLD